MIFEWYTGSDKTKKRVKTFFRLYYHSRERSTTQALVRQIEKLAKRERDRNMRAKFLTIARSVQEGHESKSGGRSQLITEFDPYAGNFPWVVPQYLEACRAAQNTVPTQDEKEGLLRAAPYAFAQALWSDSRSDADSFAISLGTIADALTYLGENLGSTLLFEMACIAAIRAHHVDTEEPAPLRILAAAYRGLGDKASETRALDQLKEVEFRDEGECESRITASVEKFRSLLGLGDEDLQ